MMILQRLFVGVHSLWQVSTVIYHLRPSVATTVIAPLIQKSTADNRHFLSLYLGRG